MTYPAFAVERWTLPTWERLRDVDRPWRLSDWVVDPLERAMIVVICVLGGVLLWTLTSPQPATGLTARDACVLTALDEAKRFARVMGDDRLVPYSFAERACAAS